MNTHDLQRFDCSRAWLVFLVLLLSPTALAQESVCARVRIEILQELTLERQAFEARMTIHNGLPDVPLTDVQAEVSFADRNGVGVRATSDPNDTSAKFFIRPQTEGELPTSVAGGSTARGLWLIIPAPGAAGADPQGELYFVGATLRYTAAGQTEEVEVSPDSIWVKPMPMLELDYFLPEQVYGDDPFTQDFVEPVVPFPLGVRVRNTGYGIAQKLRIESAQPRIVENQLGLLIDFRIDGSEVNGLPATPSLLCDFGNILPNRSGVARWIMTSTLSGQFVEFSAYYTHADELGGELTSLIASQPRAHRLIWDVHVDLPGRDGIRDFLARDSQGGPLKVYESDNVDSAVFDQSASASITTQAGAIVIDPDPTAGFLYLKKADPYTGLKRVRSVVRSDGKRLPAANAWFAATWDRDARRWNHFVNLFDVNNTAGLVYTLELENRPEVPNRAPKLDPLSNWTLRAGDRVTFPVTASDPDGDKLKFVLEGTIPEGVTLDAATGLFAWRPSTGQAPSTNDFLVRVEDSATPPLTDRGTFRIVVTDASAGNAPPTVTLSTEENLDYVENDGPRLIDAAAAVTDADSANFGGGALVARFETGGLAEDRLGIRSQEPGETNITLADPKQVRFGGIEIGTYAGGTDGSSPLRVELNTVSTVASVQQVIRNLVYRNVSERPSSVSRRIQLVLSDGDGGTAAPVVRTVAVTPVNDPPVARPDQAATVVNRPVTIVVLKLTANDSDPDSDLLKVDVPSGASDQGGVVELAGGRVTYRPPAGFAGTDGFLYRLKDEVGAEALGRVTVQVRTSNGGRLNIESIQMLSDGSSRLVVLGVPGVVYTVEASPDLVTWEPVGSVAVGPDGRFSFTDPDAQAQGRRFYRIVGRL